jgi:transketolase
MNMRQQFVKTIENTLDQDDNLVLLLGDIGVFGFRKAFEKFPARVYNIGILEQATVSLAAGLAKTGLVPVIHTIAPFLIERSLEQLKIDFGYQRLGGNFISVGASYDYAALGCTHHCPGDIALLKTIPGMNIIVPGSDRDFDVLFRAAYSGHNPNYFRLTEEGHALDVPVTFSRGTKICEGRDGTVVAIGPMLERVVNACINVDVTILYYTTLSPFDAELLSSTFKNGKIAVVEPFYEGTMSHDIVSSLQGKSINMLSVGVPRKFLTNYGLASEHDAACGLDVAGIKAKLEGFFNAKR